MATDAEKLGACVVLPTELSKPVGSTANDCRDDRNCFHICHRGRAPVQAGVGRKWRLQSGATGLALERLDEAGLFTTDVGACASMYIYIEVVT